jgi:transposase-like protein
MAIQRTPIRVKLSDEERKELEHLARSYAVPHRSVVRAKIILLLARGRSVSAVSREVGCERKIVRKWAKRFQRERLPGLCDLPRSGRPARFSPQSCHSPGEARV